jgi:hypothetical protein
MIRKFTIVLPLLIFALCFHSCKEDEVSAPPKTSFNVNATTGDINETEFTFTIDEVNADAISLLPYGRENLKEGGILLTNFVDGKATVKFKYAIAGTFAAVVVTNNHAGDGESANTYSDQISITVGSDRNSLKEFYIDKSTDTTQVGNDISVTMPFGTDLTKLKPQFNASPFSKVTVGGAEVKSGATEVNLSSPTVFTVTSNRGAAVTYNVTVNVTPVEKDNTLKTITGKEVSKVPKDRVVPGDINNVDRRVVIYDVLGTSVADFDSVRLNYAVNGKFAIVKYNDKKLKQDSLLNLTTKKTIVVFGQDSVQAAYDIYAVAAPKLSLSFNSLIPPVAGKTENFTIKLTVLPNTSITDLIATTSVQTPLGVTVTGIKAIAGEVETIAPVNGVTPPINFTKPVIFELTVQDNNLGFSYKVRYEATVVKTP